MEEEDTPSTVVFEYRGQTTVVVEGAECNRCGKEADGVAVPKGDVPKDHEGGVPLCQEDSTMWKEDNNYSWEEFQ